MRIIAIAIVFFCCTITGQLAAQNSKIYFTLNEALENPTKVYKLNLSGKKINKLPEDFSKFTNLTYLDLSNNELKELPKDFSKLQNLKFLNLGLNNFESFPQIIFEMSLLQELFIFNNYITEIPKEINQLKYLQTFDFTSNYIKEIPAELLQVESLSEILGESNRIKELPIGFVNLKNLSTLLLGDNPINKISAEIYKLQNLKYLSIPIKTDQNAEKSALRKSLKRTKISFNDFKDIANRDTTLRNDAFNLKAKIIRGNRSENSPMAMQNIKLKEDNTDTFISTFSDNNGDFEFLNLSIEKTYTLELENLSVNENENIYLAKSNGEIIKTLKTDDNGNFVFEFLPQDIYTMKVLKDEDAVLFTTRTKKNKFETQIIHFKSASYDLNSEDKLKLENVIQKLKEETVKNLEIISYTDSRGEEKDNLELSKKRSEAVQSFLIEKGIAKNRIKAIGMGEKNLLNNCVNNVNCSENEHQVNRRTELKFYSNK